MAKLESDIAYFQTRLQLIGELNSTHRLAQHKVFKLLLKSAARELFNARRRKSRGGKEDVLLSPEAMF
ncbi:hypothetical protein [Caldichromatium japonicum]|uniref:hypothetical protein n=1 Tax=Caldichromatium japonicum TaxID=2699430 RepID=UPI001FEB0E63|nr:hypothetical protein [Caldichromatium japonicum]